MSGFPILTSISCQLVEFLHHGNTPIRQIGKQDAFIRRSVQQTDLTCAVWVMLVLINSSACEHLVGHSSDPAIFKKPQLVPVQDLKLLAKDYPVCGTPTRASSCANVVCFADSPSPSMLLQFSSTSATMPRSSRTLLQMTPLSRPC